MQAPDVLYPSIARPSTPERVRGRQVQSVPEPYVHTPKDEDLFVQDTSHASSKPNVDLLRDHFLHEGRLTESQALLILKQATELMSREPNMLLIDGPVTVCGDIHGQFYDLMKIFEIGGKLSSSKYLFLGDYVDRGCFSIECLLYLYALKLWFPKTLLLLRGNHECRHLTEYFTFKRECLHKYSPIVYDACIESFQALPVTALIDGKFFCVHGGISPHLERLSDLNNLDRFTEPASHGLLCDLLWADPIPNFGREHEPSYEHPQPIAPGTLWEQNTTRGCSYYYTYEAACKFLERNELLGIFRGHEVQDHGYTMHRKTPTKKFPSVITIFSAPNYLDVYHNRGAVIKYKDRNITIRQFNASPHPYWLPNFMDAFTWSLPFVGSKITDMLLAILSICSQEELEADSEDEDRKTDEEEEEEDGTRAIADLALSPRHLSERRQEIKNKILAVGRMQKVFQILRAESENATELSPGSLSIATEEPVPGSWPGAVSPTDALGVQINNVRRQIRSFDDARRSDIANERLPQFDPNDISLVTVPSMRIPRLDDGQLSGDNHLEALIRKALEEEGVTDTEMAERLAGKIAMGNRTPSPRTRGLKRFETA